MTCFLQTVGNVAQTTFSENQIWLWGHVKLEMSKWCKLLPDIGKWRLKIWTDCQCLCTPGLKFHERPIPSFQTSKRQPLPCFPFSSANRSRWSERSPRSAWLVVNVSLWFSMGFQLNWLLRLTMQLCMVTCAKSLVIPHPDSLLWLVWPACETPSCTWVAVFEPVVSCREQLLAEEAVCTGSALVVFALPPDRWPVLTVK